jgi:Ras-related protein Rab-7A
MKDKYTNQHRVTVGADLFSGEIVHEGKPITLQIWDTAGQERFQSIGRAFYKGSDACIIAYDITEEKVQ